MQSVDGPPCSNYPNAQLCCAICMCAPQRAGRFVADERVTHETHDCDTRDSGEGQRAGERSQGSGAQAASPLGSDVTGAAPETHFKRASGTAICRVFYNGSHHIMSTCGCCDQQERKLFTDTPEHQTVRFQEDLGSCVCSELQGSGTEPLIRHV